METGKDRTQLHFEAARRRAFWNQIRRLLSGRSNRLLSWRDVQDQLHPSDFVDREVVSVPLDRIVGSVGRYREFDRAFMPLLDSTAPRWRSIARAYFDHVRLPPVTLYKMADNYFVIDGHHRVSVARELGRAFVDAKVFEAQQAIRDGATELDMVINVGALKSRDYELLERDIASLARVCHAGNAILKVIIEAALLTDEEKVVACHLAKTAGADFVKTSTGFGPGGATPEDVALMRRVVGPEMGVKAAGGIRTHEAAEEMIAAGASRIGASASVRIVTAA